MKTEAIIFDLYGTLIYTEHKSNSYLDFFRSLDLSKIEQSFWRQKIMTENFDSFQTLRDLIRPNSNLYVDKWQWEVLEELKRTKLFDDTEFVLNELSKRFEIYLISNIATPYKQCFYGLGLDRWIKEPVFSCDVGFKKPSSEIYQIIIEKSGLNPGRLLMIGDSQKCDYLGPRSLGIQSILKDKPLKLILDSII
jgi:HAD superfamily hydrolase (TIGR01549 family)